MNSEYVHLSNSKKYVAMMCTATACNFIRWFKGEPKSEEATVLPGMCNKCGHWTTPATTADCISRGNAGKPDKLVEDNIKIMDWTPDHDPIDDKIPGGYQQLTTSELLSEHQCYNDLNGKLCHYMRAHKTYFKGIERHTATQAISAQAEVPPLSALPPRDGEAGPRGPTGSGSYLGARGVGGCFGAYCIVYSTEVFKMEAVETVFIAYFARECIVAFIADPGSGLWGSPRAAATQCGRAHGRMAAHCPSSPTSSSSSS